jgi:DNA polymerase (family 10)
MDKKEIAALLDEMGTLLELQGANPFKSRAFHNASRAVEGITQELAGLIDAGRLLEVKGIGKSIAEIITDLVKTGKSREYTDLRKQIPDGVLDMLRIQGLGPKRVKILWERLKIRNLDELQKGGSWRRLKGSGRRHRRIF